MKSQLVPAAGLQQWQDLFQGTPLGRAAVCRTARYLGVSATCRASMGMYNTTQEIDVLVDALELAHELFA